MSSRYIACLNLDPAFLSAGIYLCLSRTIIYYGEHLPRFAPCTYTTIFITSDIFALILQAVGGALADTADTSKRTQYGVNILIAGLSCQEVSLFCFMSLCADFAKQVRKHDATSKGRAEKGTLLDRSFSIASYSIRLRYTLPPSSPRRLHTQTYDLLTTPPVP